MLSNLLFILLFALGVMPIDYDMTGTFSPLARLFPFTQGLIRTRHALIPGFEDTINVPMFLFLVCSFALFWSAYLFSERLKKTASREARWVRTSYH